MLKQEWGTCGQRATPAEVLNEVRVRTLLRVQYTGTIESIDFFLKLLHIQVQYVMCL